MRINLTGLRVMLGGSLMVDGYMLDINEHRMISARDVTIRSKSKSTIDPHRSCWTAVMLLVDANCLGSLVEMLDGTCIMLCYAMLRYAMLIRCLIILL